MRSVSIEVGTLVAGKFRLERPLAQGGMGSVWVAFNTQLEVPVAVKFMAPAMVQSTELVARFEREAKAAAQLRNPHVVQIFEHGVDRGIPFIAMELLEGEDLTARLKKRGRLPVGETARILGDVCKALRKAHEMGIVHRDLKPANVFLSRHEEYEVVKVLDFGIAKAKNAAGDGETKTGALVGSPHYMAPEQARRTNKAVDHRSDLWAVGVIAFRCLTGQLPFAGDDLIDVLVRVCTTAPPTPSSLAPDLGPEVDRFFERALSRDPEGRFQSAKELADALNRLAGIEPPMGLDRSWSDPTGQARRSSDQALPRLSGPAAAIPPPRASQPSGPTRPAPQSLPSQPLAATAGPQAPAVAAPRVSFGPMPAAAPAVPSSAPRPSNDHVDEEARTIPIQSPAAQRAATNAWQQASAARPFLQTMPLDSPAMFGAKGPSAPGTPPVAPAGVVARPPASSAADIPTMAGVLEAGGRMPAAPSAPVQAAPALGLKVDGTLTSAGTEVSAVPGKRDNPWIIIGAIVAVVVVIGVIGAVVLLGGEGSGSAEQAAPPLWTAPTPAATDASSAAPSTTAAAPSATASNEAPSAAAPSAEPTAKAGAAPKPGATASGTSDDDEARRALLGTATPTTKPTAKPPKKSSSYLDPNPSGWDSPSK